MYKKHGKKVSIMIFQGEQLFGGGNLICCHIIIKDKVTNYHVVQMGVIRKVLHSQRQWDMISNSGKIKINVQKKAALHGINRIRNNPGTFDVSFTWHQ